MSKQMNNPTTTKRDWEEEFYRRHGWLGILHVDLPPIVEEIKQIEDAAVRRTIEKLQKKVDSYKCDYDWNFKTGKPKKGHESLIYVHELNKALQELKEEVE